ncbi:MAG: prolipoprotein diacylglyceryl transferase family protein [Planctomycetota bacterium]
MRSELFLIPVEYAGVPIFGFGVLLAVWAVALAAILWWLLRQPNGRAEVYAQLPVFAVVTLVIIGLPWVMPGGLPIRGYGVMLVLAASTGLAMAVHRARARGVAPDTVLSMAFAMFLLGILGARVFFVVRYWDDAFAPYGTAEGLRKALFFTEGGLVVYGSLIGGAIAFVWFTRRQGLPMLAMADVIAPSLVVGLAIGRIGCLLNGCCYGGVCDRPWAVTFPRHHSSDRTASAKYSPPYGDQVSRGQMHGFRLVEDASSDPPTVAVGSVTDDGPAGLKPGDRVAVINGSKVLSLDQAQFLVTKAYDAKQPIQLRLASGAAVTAPAASIRQRSLPVHPTQIYSAVNAGLLAWFLWLYYPFRRRDGEVVALLLTIYPLARFLLEAIRTDDSFIAGTGLTTSQNVSILLLATMVPVWWYLFSQSASRTDRFVAA